MQVPQKRAMIGYLLFLNIWSSCKWAFKVLISYCIVSEDWYCASFLLPNYNTPSCNRSQLQLCQLRPPFLIFHAINDTWLDLSYKILCQDVSIRPCFGLYRKHCYYYYIDNAILLLHICEFKWIGTIVVVVVVGRWHLVQSCRVARHTRRCWTCRTLKYEC